MSGLIQPAFSNPISNTPKSIINRFAVAGWAMSSMNVPQLGLPAVVKSGVTVANTLKTVLNLTGPGVINFLGVLNDTAPYTSTIRAQLILDGVTVFDFTSAANVGSGNQGAYLIGSVDASASPILTVDFVPFKTSCVLNIATSLGGTNLVGIPAIYRLG